MNTAKQSMTALLAAIGLVLFVWPAQADVSVFTPVTPHAEEALTWCGAAAGQMIVGAYPASPCSPIQADVWSQIQANKVEAIWDTDPAGLKQAMMNLCPPPGGGHWVVFSNTTATSLMYAVAFWMRSNSYPVAAVLATTPHNSYTAHREQWVAIKGIVTDVDPLTTSSVTLKYIFIVQQASTLGSPLLERFLTGAQWYAEFASVTLPASAYNGKFVAIIEPPRSSGVASAPQRVMTGEVLRPERILSLLRSTLRSREWSRFDLVRQISRLRPGRPLLVDPDRGAYYLVPFGDAGRGNTMAAAVNAYTGELLEVARVPVRPVLAEREAVDRALQFLARHKDKAPPAVRTALVSDGESPYFPLWRVNIERDEVLVDFAGNVRRPIPRRPPER